VGVVRGFEREAGNGLDMAAALTPKYEQFRSAWNCGMSRASFMSSSQCAGSSKDISILLGQPVEEFDERFFASELGGGLGLKVSAREYIPSGCGRR